MEAPASSSASDDNVRVAVRCRPLNSTETQTHCKTTVEVDEVNGEISVLPFDNKRSGATEQPRTYTFDSVFGPASKQVEVYTKAARAIIDNVLEGYNGTIFAYGQTGTGKTFTMTGDTATPEGYGIIPNSFAHIFNFISQCGVEKQFLVRVSYLEIYNEEVRDLLGRDDKMRLELKERSDIGVYVKDLSTVTVSGADDMERAMTAGNKNRSTATTNMNERSSRSHAIFTITIECSEIAPDKSRHVRVGKLNLVDLAGSERQSKTGATGQRLVEASKINLSLSTLGNVISSLVDAKATHVPYRNSKLTRLLQDSLGGNAKTVMIANIGPADYNYDETMSTLRYAHRAKSIRNKAHINEDPKDALLRKFQHEIEELRKKLAEGGSDASGDEGISDGETPGTQHSPKTKHSDEHLRVLEQEIADVRRQLEADMDDGQRRTIQSDLEDKEAVLAKAREEHDALVKKLELLERKVIVGGENLLEKAETQAQLLEQARRELDERAQRELELRRTLEVKKAERLDIEEKYTSLQEEAVGKTKKLKKVWTLLNSAKTDLGDLRQEQQRETEALLDNIRDLAKELKLQQMLIDACIPGHYLEFIEQNCIWSEEVGDWQLKCVAYTGNNMRKAGFDPGNEPTSTKLRVPNLTDVYLSYAEDAGADVNAPLAKAGKKNLKKEKKKAQMRVILQ